MTHQYNKDNTLIFLHIYKAAGMTMRQIAARQYINQPQHMFNNANGYRIEDFLTLSEDERAQLRYIGGHLMFGVHRFTLTPASYITLFRDPRDHLISYYYFFREMPSAQVYELIKDKTFEEFIQMPHMNAIQLDMIVGYDQEKSKRGRWGAWRNRRLPVETKLEIAEKHLREHFAAVGLVERFDESMLVMRQRLGWDNVYYGWRHFNKSRPRDAQEIAQHRALIEEYAKPDIALYELACRIYEEQRAQYQGDLEADLARYRQRNKLFSRLWTISQSIRELPMYRMLRKMTASNS